MAASEFDRALARDCLGGGAKWLLAYMGRTTAAEGLRVDPDAVGMFAALGGNRAGGGWMMRSSRDPM